MNSDDLRRRATVVREVASETVLILRGAVRDRHDRFKWHTEQGPVSVSGPKFMNWHRGTGGGGAIDLVMHLANVDFRTAVGWLEQHLGVGHLAVGQAVTRYQSPSRKEPTASQGQHTLGLPARDDRMLGRVIQYLTRRRHLAPSLLEPLIELGKLYADSRGNAVFLLLAGKANRPVGAELRGTGPRVWRGMVPGTRKDLGYFWIGAKGSKEIVLCESAIDAISCLHMHPQRIFISTSGVRANPPWLCGLIAHGYEIHCGFDADSPGDAAATQMIALHPAVKRLRPPAHDWNDALASLQ
jgi:hypothetical protein